MKLLPVVFFLASVGLGACAFNPHSNVASDSNVPSTATAQIIDVSLVQDQTYSWSNRQWSPGDLQNALVQEAKQRPISEVRLIDTGKFISIANAIDISQMAKAVGARAYLQSKAKFNEIVELPN